MDPVSMGLLASATVKVLGPYLAELAEKASDTLTERASDAAASGAVKAAGHLLELVRNKFHGKSEAETSLDRLATAPADARARAAVEENLKTEMGQDPEFASEISKRLTQIANTQADLAFVNNIQGDVGKIAQFGTVYGDVTF